MRSEVPTVAATAATLAGQEPASVSPTMMRGPTPSRRQILSGGAGTALALLLGPAAAARAQGGAGPAASATAITEVFGDGQKLVAVAVEFDRPIPEAALSPATFRVAGRTVTAVYAATAADPASRAAAGRFAIVALSPDDPGAALRQREARGPRPDRPPRGGQPSRPADVPMGGPSSDIAAPAYRPAVATVTQALPIVAADGGVFEPGGPFVTARVHDPVVDRFRQMEFHDPVTGDTLRYNLFTPENGDSGRRYPLVLFMHDLGATGPDPLTTLRQGLGAVIWASPAEQAKRPCFVLAPQYAEQIVNDRSEATSLLDTTIHLVRSLTDRLPIDRDRLYATGQSGGAMMTIAMNIKYPGFFAASFIVAGQWNPELTRPLARQRQWIVVSQGDTKAYPGQNAIVAVLEREGARVSRAVWDGRSTPAQFDAAVARMAAEGSAINYTALEKGTVVPPGEPEEGGGDHRNTWRIAYTIEGIRDWLFRQRRS